MGKIPNGLQEHVLFTMDGRSWIENIHSCGKTLERQIERGWAIRIPQDKLEEFIKEVREHGKRVT